MKLGARQARYLGHAKTELQWILAAVVANLAKAAQRIDAALKRLLRLQEAPSKRLSVGMPYLASDTAVAASPMPEIVRMNSSTSAPVEKL